MKMVVQSIFDVRRSLQILQDVFVFKTPLNQYFGQGHLQNKLMQFQWQTISLIDHYEKNYPEIQNAVAEKESKLLKLKGIDTEKEKKKEKKSLASSPAKKKSPSPSPAKRGEKKAATSLQ